VEEVGFGLTKMAWNGGSRFLSDWNALEWRKSGLAQMKWVGMNEVRFGLSGKA
jgi:hypothetical protein